MPLETIRPSLLTVVHGDGVSSLILQWTDPGDGDPIRLCEEMLDETLTHIGDC